MNAPRRRCPGGHPLLSATIMSASPYIAHGRAVLIRARSARRRRAPGSSSCSRRRGACCRGRCRVCLAPPGELAFLIDPIGPGTRALCALRAGRPIHVLGPLGNGFRLDVERPLLVGGGIGIAPLPFLSERLGGAAGAARLPLGVARGGGRARAERRGRDRAHVRHRGAELAGHDVLACGPEPMLEAVRALAPDAQLAWEAPMACGYGACYGCAVEIDGELKRLCVEGPVLAAA